MKLAPKIIVLLTWSFLFVSAAHADPPRLEKVEAVAILEQLGYKDMHIAEIIHGVMILPEGVVSTPDAVLVTGIGYLKAESTEIRVSLVHDAEHGWQHIRFLKHEETGLRTFVRRTKSGRETVTHMPPYFSSEEAEKRCQTQLRLLELAKYGAAKELQREKGAVLTQEEITSRLSKKALPECPRFGTYQLNPLGKVAECSIHGKLKPQEKQ